MEKFLTFRLDGFMKKQSKKRSRKIGLPPGTLVYTGEAVEDRIELEMFDFTESIWQEKVLTDPAEILPYLHSESVTWVNMNSVSQVEVIENVGKLFGIHPLILEDIVNVHQRPKIEIYDGTLYVVLHQLRLEIESGEIESEQISIVLKDGILFTFQERKGDLFDPLRDRIRKGKGLVRGKGIDYLLYTIIDLIVDHYYLILEKIGDEIDELELKLEQDPSGITVQKLYTIRRKLILLRRSIWPVRDVLSTVLRDPIPLSEQVKPFFRDVYDHVIQIMDAVDTYRDLTTGLLDSYLNTMSNRLNEVMKVLTIISTFFLPLTFLVGVYGMNFEYMPELKWKWGYPLVWLVMLGISSLMWIFFRRKKWL